jgi:ADP-heptose:LPS heptosyltransferase
MWREEHWIAVARWFLENGMRVALTGSPDPAERAYVDALAQQLPDTVINAAGKLTLGGTAALIARAQFYVGPDTAITHLAAATGVPTVALFGPTDPALWKPPSPLVRALRSPGRLPDPRGPEFGWMEGLEVAQVWAAWSALPAAAISVRNEGM